MVDLQSFAIEVLFFFKKKRMIFLNDIKKNGLKKDNFAMYFKTI